MDLHVTELATKLRVVVFSPILWVESGEAREDLIVDDGVAYHTCDDKRLVLFNHGISIKMWGEHIECADATDIR